MLRTDTFVELEQPGPPPPTSIILTTTQVAAALGVSLGSMIIGFCSAWSSPAIASLMEPGGKFEVTEIEASWIGSLMPLAALIGGFAGGPLLELVGRKLTLVLTALPFIVAALMVTYANSVSLIYAGRSITGFCIGIVSLSLPVYLAETIHPEVRGTLGMLPATLGNSGVMLVYILGFWLDWSQLSLAGAVIPVPFLIVMFLIPETPRYLVSKGRVQSARSALQWFRGPCTDVNAELHAIEMSCQLSSKSELKFTDLFRKEYLKPLSISLGLMFFQQFSGINAVMFYSVSIFEASGSSIQPNIAAIILGVVNIVATIGANLLIDRLGRKVLLYISDSGMVASLSVFGAYFYLKDALQMEIPGWIPLVALMTYVCSFSMGFGPIPWLMMGEILPGRIRGAAASIATAFNWTCTFIVTKTFMDMQLSIGSYGAFWLFASILVIAMVFIILVVPETGGKSLEDIEKLYARKMSMDDTELAPSLPAGFETRHRVSSLANIKLTPSQIF